MCFEKKTDLIWNSLNKMYPNYNCFEKNTHELDSRVKMLQLILLFGLNNEDLLEEKKY